MMTMMGTETNELQYLFLLEIYLFWKILFQIVFFHMLLVIVGNHYATEQSKKS